MWIWKESYLWESRSETNTKVYNNHMVQYSIRFQQNTNYLVS